MSLKMKRAQGMPGARRTRSSACKSKNHRFAGSRRHSLRDGFTVSFVLSLVIGLCCHHPGAMQSIIAS
jgi:hypothetical protein